MADECQSCTLNLQEHDLETLRTYEDTLCGPCYTLLDTEAKKRFTKSLQWLEENPANAARLLKKLLGSSSEAEAIMSWYRNNWKSF